VSPPSQKATNYRHWQNTYESDAPTLYIAAHFYNITNLDDVRRGALPIVQEVGPYVYWCVYRDPQRSTTVSWR
jgi:hypothetical protein